MSRRGGTNARITTTAAARLFGLRAARRVRRRVGVYLGVHSAARRAPLSCPLPIALVGHRRRQQKRWRWWRWTFALDARLSLVPSPQLRCVLALRGLYARAVGGAHRRVRTAL